MSLAKQKAHIREQLMTNDRWILVALITVYEYQTASEQQSRSTNQHNGVGFTGADAKTLCGIAQHILRRTTLQQIRRTPDIKLSDVMDKDWAIDAVRKRMPKYANQLAKLARDKETK